jgi:precorrin-6A/cobalt-precorrin-6A reductase
LTGIPFFRFMRSTWSQPAGAVWEHVPGFADAASSLPLRAQVFVTSGHAGLDAFAARKDCDMLVRLIEAPQETLPGHMRLLLDRPPYSLEGEVALMQREGTTHLVTKNSGGEQTRAKIDAAALLGIPVVMIERPTYAPAPEVSSLEEALAMVHGAAS